MKPLVVLMLSAMAAFAAEPFAGVWKMDPAKSQFPGQAPKHVQITYAPDARGFKVTIHGTLPDDTPYTYWYACSLDNTECPVTGHPVYESVAAKWDGTRLVTQYKREGRVLTTITSEFLEEGKTMISRAKGVNSAGKEIHNQSHFDKQ